MILQYQNELLALAIIFILLFIYLYLKRKPASSQKDTFTEITEENTKNIHNEIEVESVSKPVNKQTVPNHGKITKEDFKLFSGERILLAEDNLINQKVILGVLGNSGIEVIVANDGQEALDILQKDKDFMIILMDAHMPRIDGFEATKIIKQNPQYNHIAIVALSGDVASDDIKKMKDAGMKEHLEKPLKIDALYDILYQYSHKSKLTNPPSDLEVLAIQRGLQIAGNDVDFYHDILKEFLSTYSNSAEELEILLKDNKTAQADQLLLDIVGVSANIGADALTSSANDIKNSISKNEQVKLTTYSKNLQELIQNINNYFLTCN